MKMDTQYFINKFEAIPEKKWIVCSFSNGYGAHCANGHCGATTFQRNTEEVQALYDVMINLPITIPDDKKCNYGSLVNHERYAVASAAVNNGDAAEYQQATPKQRILAALRDIQAKEQGENAVKEAQSIVNQPVELV